MTDLLAVAGCGILLPGALLGSPVVFLVGLALIVAAYWLDE